MRIIDETLPANGGSGFLKIDPHYNVKIFRELFDERPEARAVFKGGGWVMN